MSHTIYELKNCVRTHSLVEMRDDLLEHIQIMREALEQIKDNDIVINKNN